MNIWHDLQPDMVRREEYTVFTANSIGSTAILSFDGGTGLLCLDHVGDSNIGASNNTGFLPRTCTQEGLPIETVLLCNAPLPAMTLVRCRPVGLIVLHLEQGGVRKLMLSAACADEFWSACLTVDEIPTAHRKALVRYLRYDQQVIGQPAASIEFQGLEQAEKYFDVCRQDYLLRYCGVRPQENTEAISEDTPAK
ncbi:MAG: inorganic diphosphatase [Eubacteriales bacterium]|nr:inorganic diphosphatase [Eubacteriales bacterium]